MKELTGSQYNGVATTFVLGSDGYVYKSVNGAAWSTVSAPGATHVQPLPGQGSALFSTATAISLVNSSGAITGLTALPAGVMVKDFSVSNPSNVAYVFVLATDGYVYQSVNGGSWSKVSAPGATKVVAWPGQGGATYSTATAISLTSSSGTITGFAALPGGISVTDFSVSNPGYVGHVYVLGNDGYVYESVNGGAWGKVSTSGVTHVEARPGQSGAIYSVDASC